MLISGPVTNQLCDFGELPQAFEFHGGCKIIKLHSSAINPLVQQTFIACHLSARHHASPFCLLNASDQNLILKLPPFLGDFRERNYHSTFIRSQITLFDLCTNSAKWQLHFTDEKLRAREAEQCMLKVVFLLSGSVPGTQGWLVISLRLPYSLRQLNLYVHSQYFQVFQETQNITVFSSKNVETRLLTLTLLVLSSWGGQILSHAQKRSCTQSCAWAEGVAGGPPGTSAQTLHGRHLEFGVRPSHFLLCL